MSGTQHDHEAGTRCGDGCPNRAANLARSNGMRCAEHGRINCPTLHLTVAPYTDEALYGRKEERP